MNVRETISSEFVDTLKKKLLSRRKLVPLILFFTFFIFYSYTYKSIPIRYWDEHAWIGQGYYFDLYIRGDINNPEWFSFYSYGQPKLTEYLYGLTLYPNYLSYCKDSKCDYITFLLDHNFDRVTQQKYLDYIGKKTDFIKWGGDNFEDFDVSGAYLLNKYGDGFDKTLNIIYQSRRSNVLLLSLNVIVTYYMLLLIFRPGISSLIVFIYGLNPLLINAGLRAQSEGLFILLFNTSLFLLIVYFIKRESTLLLVLFSISVALLTETKLNGIMLLFYFEFLLFIQFIRRISVPKKIIGHFLLSITIFCFLFVLLHPFFYNNPPKNTFFMYNVRYQISGKLTQSMNQGYAYLPDFSSRIARIYRNFYSKNSLLFYNLPITVKTLTNNKFSYTIFLLTIITSLIGVLEVVKGVVKNNKPIQLFLLAFMFIQITTAFYLLIDWDRYYIHLILFFSCLLGLGINKMYLYIVSEMNRIKSHKYNL